LLNQLLRGNGDTTSGAPGLILTSLLIFGCVACVESTSIKVALLGFGVCRLSYRGGVFIELLLDVN